MPGRHNVPFSNLNILEEQILAPAVHFGLVKASSIYTVIITGLLLYARVAKPLFYWSHATRETGCVRLIAPTSCTGYCH
jgi:hypothetical protein